MTFEEWWNSLCSLDCKFCKEKQKCDEEKKTALEAWETAQLEPEKLAGPVKNDNPAFDKEWNNDILQNPDDSEARMSIREYAKYWFQKGQSATVRS